MSVKEKWMEIRNENWGIDWLTSESDEILTRDSFEDTSTRPCFSNLTDYVPLFVYCPIGGWPNLRSYTAEDIDRPFLIAKELMQSYKIKPAYWRMESAATRFYGSLFRARGMSPSVFSLRFMYCLIKNGLVQRDSRVAWVAVIPIENSVQFHTDFISHQEIAPDKYGIEFWYDPEAIKINRSLQKLFKVFIKEQLGELGLRAIKKTEAEMNSLLILNSMSNLIPQHNTPAEAKKWCSEMFHKVISGQTTTTATTGDVEYEEIAREIVMERANAERPANPGLLAQIQNASQLTYQPLTNERLGELLMNLSGVPAQGVQVRNDPQYVIGVDPHA